MSKVTLAMLGICIGLTGCASSSPAITMPTSQVRYDPVVREVSATAMPSPQPRDEGREPRRWDRKTPTERYIDQQRALARLEQNQRGLEPAQVERARRLRNRREELRAGDLERRLRDSHLQQTN